ncbi:hypothetical protein BDQ17DRAFT_813693 [Cyathus striatus]|nr:hypothetical protein BDQ17DRAFT_813693 [Cyathus striatus]
MNPLLPQRLKYNIQRLMLIWLLDLRPPAYHGNVPRSPSIIRLVLPPSLTVLVLGMGGGNGLPERTASRLAVHSSKSPYLECQSMKHHPYFLTLLCGSSTRLQPIPSLFPRWNADWMFGMIREYCQDQENTQCDEQRHVRY